MKLSPDQLEIFEWIKAHLAELSPAPAFLYFFKFVERRVQQLRTALGPEFELLYSVKANANEDLLRRLCKLNLALDISSAGELETSLHCGFRPDQLSFVGPGKTEEELRLALHHQIGTIIVESLSELDQLNSIANAMGERAPVSLRIHPANYCSPSGRPMLRAPSAFGIAEDELPEVLRHLRDFSGCRIEGVHCHVGSMYFKPELIVQNFRRVMDLACHVSEAVGPLKQINFGGGLAIPYSESDMAVDLPALRTEVRRFLGEMPASQLGDPEYRLEAGRYLVGEAGCYLTHVLQRKASFGRTYLVVEGGINHHLAATGYGQTLRRHFPMAGISASPSQELEKVHVVGSSCYSQDVLGEDVELPRLQAGDRIVVFQSGAYGPSFSPRNFLSRPPAREVVI